MKRVLALVLVCLLILSLSACSGVKLTDPEDVAPGMETAIVQGIESGDIMDFNEFVSEEQKKEQERVQKQEEERREQEEQLSVPPKRGTVNGGVYTNDYLGLQFEPSFGFIFYNHEEIGKLVGQDHLVYTVENLIAEDSPVDSIYEMMAVDMQNNNVVLCYENLEKSGFGSYTEAQYLRSIYMATIENPGYTCNWEDRGAYALGGVEFQMLPVTIQTNGRTMTQGYFIKKFGKYFVQIIVTAAPDAYPVILNCFSKK